MTEQQLSQAIAVMLFQKSKLTLAQAARLANMNRLQFQHLLAIGLEGVLLEAKSKGFIPASKPVMEDLRLKAGFRLGERVYQQLVKRASE